MRIDVLETINRNSPDELDADSLEETLSGMTPWSRQTLNQIMTRYIHVVSGGKLRYKTPIRLADYLFGLGDDWLCIGPMKVFIDGSLIAADRNDFAAELAKQGFLLWRRLGDAAQTDLTTVGGGKNDVGALQGGKQRNSPHRRQGLGIIDAACG